MSTEEKYDPKTFKMYMKVANDVQAHSILTSYFVTNFTINKAVEYLKTQRAQGHEDPELTKEVQGWFQTLEELKKAVGAELQDREECKKQYYEYAYSYFLRADNKYRDDDYSPQLAQDFFYATVLLDAYNIFGPSNTEIATHKKYAKVARLKIMKAIKSGNMPIPKTQQRQSSETEIPDDNSAGVKAFGNFQVNQSTINKAQQNNLPSSSNPNNSYSNPYGQSYQPTPSGNIGGYGGYGTEHQQSKDSFGQGNVTGLPDFAKFDNSHQSATNQQFGNNYPAQNTYGTGAPGFNLGFGGNQPPASQPTQPRSTQPRRNPDFYQKAEKAKDLCKKALAELEYKRLRQFKENLESALELLEAAEQ